MGSSIFIRGKKTKSRFLNTQKPFFEHEIMQNAIWNMGKLKKSKIMVKKAIFLHRQNRYLTLPLCKMDIK